MKVSETFQKGMGPCKFCTDDYREYEKRKKQEKGWGRLCMVGQGGLITQE